MKKLKYILFIILLIIFITPRTYAYQNTSTSFDVITYDYNSQLDSTGCHDVSLLDYFQYIINNVDWSTSYYQVFATLPSYENYSLDYYDYSINLYLIPSSQIQNDYLLYRATNSSNQVGMSYQYGFNISPYYNTYNYYLTLRKNYGNHYQHCTLSTSDYRNDVATIHFIDFIQNGGWSSSTRDNVNDWGILNQNANSTYASFFEQSQTSISNDSSYNTTLWYYYSSFKYRYIPTDMSSNTFWYYKNVNLVNENKSYSVGDYFDSYFDLHTPIPTPTFIGYQESLNTTYTIINRSSVSNYQLKLKFNVPQSYLGFYQTTQEYIDNTNFNYVCSGRVVNSNYYYYESFPCSLTESHTTYNDKTIEFTFNNVSTSQNLSNYDKLYITINTNYIDPLVSTTIYGFEYSYNLGSIYNTSYKGSIYEKFENLPIDFEYYFSSNNFGDNSKLYVDTSNFTNDIYTLGFSSTNHNNYYAVGQSVLANPSVYENLVNFKVASVSNSYDTGIMIFQQNGNTSLSYLNLFFNGGMYISSNIGNNTFYYVDSNGDIISGQINQPVLVNNNNSYDIGYYVNIVNNFIDGLSSDTLEVANLTQSFYNGLPVFFQSFIFVVFILFCIYFTYLLIKKE